MGKAWAAFNADGYRAASRFHNELALPDAQALAYFYYDIAEPSTYRTETIFSQPSYGKHLSMGGSAKG